MPIFNKRLDPATNAVIPGITQVQELKTIHTIPFTKQRVNELSKHFVEPVSFIVVDKTGRKYSCSLEEFIDLPHDELVKIKTSWMFTDYHSNKQLVEAATGGNTR